MMTAGICRSNDVFLYLGSDVADGDGSVVSPIPGVCGIEVVRADLEHPALVSYSGAVTLTWQSPRNLTFSFRPVLTDLAATFAEITASSVPIEIARVGSAAAQDDDGAVPADWEVTVRAVVHDPAGFFARVLNLVGHRRQLTPGTYRGRTAGYAPATVPAMPANGYWLPAPSRAVGITLRLDGQEVAVFGGVFRGCTYVSTPDTPAHSVRADGAPARTHFAHPLTVRAVSATLRYADGYGYRGNWSLIVRCIRDDGC